MGFGPGFNQWPETEGLSKVGALFGLPFERRQAAHPKRVPYSLVHFAWLLGL